MSGEDCDAMDRGENDGQKPDKMFTLKKWNAVAMWSWDVECDTCAICRVQVMGKFRTAPKATHWRNNAKTCDNYSIHYNSNLSYEYLRINHNVQIGANAKVSGESFVIFVHVTVLLEFYVGTMVFMWE